MRVASLPLFALALPLAAAGCGGGGSSAASGASGGTPGTSGSGGAAGSVMNYATGGTTAASATGGAGGTTTTPVPTGTSDPATAPLTAPDGAVVSFFWPEAVAGDGGSACLAGHYKGTFSCSYDPTVSDAGLSLDAAVPTTGFVVTGPVEFDLAQTQNGEYLEVSGGTLNGSTFVISFTGKISGKLDCRTKKFDGMVTDGQYAILPFPPGGFFQGPTSADYSTAGPALVNGRWLFTVQDAQNNPQGSCPGTWSATYTP